MRLDWFALVFSLFVLIVVVLSGCTVVQYEELEPEHIEDILTVASWNLQVFGQAKSTNDEVMATYQHVMSDYDIIFVQEIRDKSGIAFNMLCNMMEGYRCAVAERDGRSSSKEQIGILYKPEVTLYSFERLDDSDDVWERSPVVANISVDNYSFIAYVAHLKPDDVLNEMDALESVVINEGNVMIIGDLNADCRYYKDTNPRNNFDGWVWVIDGDTTVGESYCAYDRIIINDDMRDEWIGDGIDKYGIDLTHSDHYLIYVELEI